MSRRQRITPFRPLPLAFSLVLTTGALCGVLSLLQDAIPWPAPGLAQSTPTEEPASAVVQATAEATPAAVPSLEPTPELTAEPTLEPTPIPTPSPVPTAPPAAFQPAQPAVQLAGVRHEWQTWNNCGPATIAMNLNYFGSAVDQAAAGAVLRPDPDDKNVSPWELVAYARSQGFVAEEMVNGSAALARTLLSNGIPLLVETWHWDDPAEGEAGGLGHYRLLLGYDDEDQQWIVYDSYDTRGLQSLDPYSGIRIGYGELEKMWQVFNYGYVLVYSPHQEALVTSILAATASDGATMWPASEARARAELAADDQDAFAWFNLGSSLVMQARHGEAAEAFDQARALGLPWRMFWYQFGPFAAYVNVGRNEETLALVEATLTADPRAEAEVEEVFYWQGRALAALGRNGEARAAFGRALALNPGLAVAGEALAGLP